MRNSVKAIVDAYDGSVRLFQWMKGSHSVDVDEDLSGKRRIEAEHFR